MSQTTGSSAAKRKAQWLCCVVEASVPLYTFTLHPHFFFPVRVPFPQPLPGLIYSHTSIPSWALISFTGVRHASLALLKIGHYTARFSRLLEILTGGWFLQDGHLGAWVCLIPVRRVAVRFLSQQCVYPGLFVKLRPTYHLSAGTCTDMTAWCLSGNASEAESVSTSQRLSGR